MTISRYVILEPGTLTVKLAKMTSTGLRVATNRDRGGAVLHPPIQLPEQQASGQSKLRLHLPHHRSPSSPGAYFSDVVNALTDAINSNEQLDLTNRGSLDSLFGAFLSDAELDVATAINQDIDSASSTQDISTVQARAANNNPVTGTVTITGTPKQGQTMSATNTLADADGVGSITYQWSADGIDIGQATSAIFTLTKGQVNKTMTVMATYVDGKGNTEISTSAATTVVANTNDAPTGSVTISGIAAVGQILTASNTLADLDGLGHIRYVWSANLQPITGATSNTLTLTDTEVGKTITVTASFTDGFSTVESKVSAATAPIVKTDSINQTLVGTANNDSFTGGTGNDTINGLAGIDTSVYLGARSSYTLTKTSSGFGIVDRIGNEGSDTLSSIERLSFSDKKVALDLGPTDHGGQAALFIGLMAPSLLTSPAAVGVVLDLFDRGLTMRDICQTALDAGLVKSLAGSNTNGALAGMTARNLTGQEPTAAIVDLLVSFMDGRAANYSQADFLTALSGLEVNLAHIDLVGLQASGIDYL
jgi:hypothetical protein